jgi:hypothetical protein
LEEKTYVQQLRIGFIVLLFIVFIGGKISPLGKLSFAKKKKNFGWMDA